MKRCVWDERCSSVPAFVVWERDVVLEGNVSVVALLGEKTVQRTSALTMVRRVVSKR
jgi:hypothetical protein